MVVFAAVAPAITHAIAQSAGLTYAAICTTSGDRGLALDSQSSPADDLLGAIHCPLCRLPDHAPALPSPDPAFAVAAAVGDALPVTVESEPPIDQARSHVRARAPPALS